MSAASLCSALAIADSSSFFTMNAPFFGLKESRFSALATAMPRIWSAISRPFWADRCTPRSFAVVSMDHLFLDDRFLLGRTAFEGAGQGKFAELVADHVLGDVHRDVLLAVVDR